MDEVRQPILYSFALTPLPGHKKIKKPRIKLFKKIKKSVLSHIKFYLEDDDRKLVDFNGEMIRFFVTFLKFNRKMRPNLIRPKSETEDLLLSITIKCDTPTEHTRRKAEETLENKLTKPRETFHFNPTYID